MVTNSHDVIGKINSDMQSYKYTWSINMLDFNFKKVGEKLKSPKFRATIDDMAYEWQLWLYPKGVRGSNGKSISIALYNFSNNIVTASIAFGIVNDENKVVAVKVTEKKLYNTKNDAEAKWGFYEFAEEAFVSNRDNGMIHSSLKIMIECEIKLYTSCNVERPKEADVLDENEKRLRLREFDRYEYLLDDSAFSDVSFVVEGRTLHAHKCIIVKSSPVFAAMFQNEMREKQERTIDIEDIKYSVFLEMLRFMYAGKISLEVENNVKLDVGELLFAADKYCIDGLKDKCEKFMTKNLCIDNVVDSLKVADRHNAQHLKTMAKKLIVSRSNNLFKIPNFKTLIKTPDLLCEVCFAIAHKRRISF